YIYCCTLFSYATVVSPFLHSFPTRRSSDLEPYMLLDFMMRVAEISAGSDGFIPDGSVSKRIRLCLDIGHAHAMTGPDMPVEKWRSEEHTSELQSSFDLVCRLLLEKKTMMRK